MFIPASWGTCRTAWHSCVPLPGPSPSQACTRGHKGKIMQWFQDVVHLSLKFIYFKANSLPPTPPSYLAGTKPVS